MDVFEDKFVFFNWADGNNCTWQPRKETLEKIRTKNGVLPNIIGHLRKKLKHSGSERLSIDGLGDFNEDDAVTILSIAMFSGFKYIILPESWCRSDFIRSAKQYWNVNIWSEERLRELKL